MRIINVIGPEDQVVAVDVATNEAELRELLASLFNLTPEEIKGLRDSQGVHFTLNSVITNCSVNAQRSAYFYLVSALQAGKIKKSVKKTEAPKKKTTEFKRRRSLLSNRKPEDAAKSVVKSLFIKDELTFDEYKDLLRQIEASPDKFNEITDNYLNCLVTDRNISSKLKSFCNKEAKPKEILTILKENAHLLDSETFEILRELALKGNEKLNSIFELYSFDDQKDELELLESLKLLAESFKTTVSEAVNIPNLMEKLEEKLQNYQSATLKAILNSEKELFSLWTGRFKSTTDNNLVIGFIKEQLESIFQTRILGKLNKKTKDLFYCMKEHFREEFDESMTELLTEEYSIKQLISKISKVLECFDISMQENPKRYLKITRNLKINQEKVKEAISRGDKQIINEIRETYWHNNALERKLTQIFNEIESEEENLSFLSLDPEISSNAKQDFVSIICEFSKDGHLNPMECEILVQKYKKQEEDVMSAWQTFLKFEDAADLLETLQIIIFPEDNRKKNKEMHKSNTTNYTLDINSPLAKYDRSKTFQDGIINIPEEDSQASVEEQQQAAKLPSRDTITEREYIAGKLLKLITFYYENERISLEEYKESKKMIQNSTTMLIAAFEPLSLSKDVDDFLDRLHIVIRIGKYKDTLEKYYTGRNLPYESREILNSLLRRNDCPQLKAVLMAFKEDEEDCFESLDILLECL